MNRSHALALPAAALLTALAASPAVSADASTDYQQGYDAYHAGDLPTSMRLLRRAADAGNGRAAAFLGYILDQAEEDEAAVAMYRRAIELGEPAGSYGLGTMYATGEGLDQRDHAEALRLIKAAAEAGDAEAANALGVAYLNGDLTLEVDREQGLAWLQRAADAGHEPAANRLAAERAQ